MACAELVLPGDFDHCHHGGSGLGSDRAHTVSLYRQELEVVQGVWAGFRWQAGAYRRGCLVRSVARQKDAQAGVPVPLEAVPSICHWRCVVAGAQGLRCSG